MKGSLSTAAASRFAAAALLAVATSSGCASPNVAAPSDPTKDAASQRTVDYEAKDGAWGNFHSKRFGLTVPLPDGKRWKIDDRSSPELVATEESTRSVLTLATTREEGLMNRQRCEERARARGWVSEIPYATVEDEAIVGPGAYDSRLWVAIDARPQGRIEGHVFLFGALLRGCLFVHLRTAVHGEQSEDELASRLAVASAKIVRAITLDPPRTGDEAAVPRQRR